MITDCSIEIDAPAEAVWAVYAEVERWHEWTASITSVVALDAPAIEVGRRYEIKQPRFPKLVWSVDAVDPGTAWTWSQHSPGGRTIAHHELEAIDEGRTLVRQRIDQQGPVGAVVAALTRGLTRRYLDLEATGLKARVEQHADAPPR